MKLLRTFVVGSLLLGVGMCNINVFDRAQPQTTMYDVVYVYDYYYDDYYYNDDMVYVDWQ